VFTEALAAVKSPGNACPPSHANATTAILIMRSSIRIWANTSASWLTEVIVVIDGCPVVELGAGVVNTCPNVIPMATSPSFLRPG